MSCSAVILSKEVVCFKVVFKPMLSWADETYLGNMLAEVLGIIAKNTSAFEFEIKTLPNKTEDNNSATQD